MNVSQPVRFDQNVFPSKMWKDRTNVSPRNGDERSIDLKVIFFLALLGPGKFSGAVKLPGRKKILLEWDFEDLFLLL